MSTTFQFTPLREGRQKGGKKSPQSKNFNSRPSARGDRNPHLRSVLRCISIHAPPRGATLFSKVVIGWQQHFNSRPSARGDTFRFIVRSSDKISIHAPPRGATYHRRPLPSHGSYFNSRPSARGDTALERAQSYVQLISIHAPPRGATVKENCYG